MSDLISHWWKYLCSLHYPPFTRSLTPKHIKPFWTFLPPLKKVKTAIEGNIFHKQFNGPKSAVNIPPKWEDGLNTSASGKKKKKTSINVDVCVFLLWERWAPRCTYSCIPVWVDVCVCEMSHADLRGCVCLISVLMESGGVWKRLCVCVCAHVQSDWSLTPGISFSNPHTTRNSRKKSPAIHIHFSIYFAFQSPPSPQSGLREVGLSGLKISVKIGSPPGLGSHPCV